MSGFIGLDPEQVTDFSEKLQAAAKKIDSIGLSLGVQVRQEWIWQGADAEEFRQRWTGEVLQQFSDREGALQDKRWELKRHCDEQEEASKVFDIFDMLKLGQSIYDFVEDGISAAKTIRDAWKAHKGMTPLAEYTGKLLEDALNKGKEWQAVGEFIADRLGIPKKIGSLKIFAPLNHLGEASFLSDLASGTWRKVGKGIAGAADFLNPLVKTAGKALPFVDIGLGVSDMYQAYKTGDGWKAASGALSTISGVATLAAPVLGPAAPIAMGVGAVAGVASAAIDIGTTVVKNWDSITDSVSDFFGF